jgi:hypothetical protein
LRRWPRLSSRRDETLEDCLKRRDTNAAAEQQTGGSRVKKLAEKIAAVRERREGCQAMVAELLWVGYHAGLSMLG